MKALAVLVVACALAGLVPAVAAADQQCGEVTCQAIGCPPPCPAPTTTRPAPPSTTLPAVDPVPPTPPAPAVPVAVSPRFTG
jgi:hypothetical protein